MTKPEFDKIYNEKIARGLDFPLNDLIQTLNDSQNYQKTSDILGHILAHEMARKIFGDGIGGHSVHVGNWQLDQNNSNPRVSLSVQFDIYDNSTI